MYAILFRTLFLYVLISVVIRAMGKRQVGELETSELVSTFLLSASTTTAGMSPFSSNLSVLISNISIKSFLHISGAP